MSNFSGGRIPPQALDMEKAVLGALLLERMALPRVGDMLTAEMFYKESHKIIFQAIEAIFSRMTPIDILTVRNELTETGNLEKAGGVWYLTELTVNVASAANIEYHAAIINQKWRMREIIKISDKAINDAYDDTTDVFELTNSVCSQILDLSGSANKRKSETIHEISIKEIERIEENRKAMKSGTTVGVSTGYRQISKHGTIKAGDLVIIAGRPSQGKTTFALNIAENIAREQGAVIFFSLEMDNSSVSEKFISNISQVDSRNISQCDLSDDEMNAMKESIHHLNIPIYLNDSGTQTIVTMTAEALRIKNKTPLKAIFVDYLQLMDSATKSKGMNREQEISGISRGLKRLAKDLDVPIFALSQLNRSSEQRPDKRPVLADLRESGAIEQDADVIMFVFRPEYYGFQTVEINGQTMQTPQGFCEILIRKFRKGSPGDVYFMFNKSISKFTEYETPSFYSYQPKQDDYTSPF